MDGKYLLLLILIIILFGLYYYQNIRNEKYINNDIDDIDNKVNNETFDLDDMSLDSIGF